MKLETDPSWDITIRPKRKWLEFNLLELWEYRDLLRFLIKRDIVTFYKQTILGPLWFFIQPLITAIVFSIIFGGVANISTDEIPPILFYMSGIVVWNYFSNSLLFTSSTFTSNSGLFGKVYFPRIIVPLSKIISGLVKFGVQCLMFIGFYVYFLFYNNQSLNPQTENLIILPVLIIQMGMLGMGLGLIISSLTTKYRDLSYLVNFGTQLLMYASPIVYPLSLVPEKYAKIIILNPITPSIEGFRQVLVGKGLFDYGMFINAAFFTVLLFIFGLILFNKVEKSFIDTV